jgi:cell division protein FtsI (penicillin-binding protein 3)
VENGTAKDSVASKLVAIAGKTGTAEIPDLEHHTYFKDKFIASFGGFFPYGAPVVAGIVVLSECHPVTYGGLTSGPTFRRIAERYAVLNPDIFAAPDRKLFAQENGSARTVKVPDLVGSDINIAASNAVRRGMELRASAAEGTVAWQFPPPERLSITGQAEVVLAMVTPSSGPAVMPDLSGLSLRKAFAFLFCAGIKCTVRGTGAVVSQSIAPGVIIQRGLECRLECAERRKEG